MKYIIQGGIPLSGHAVVSSAKNAVLVHMASALLVEGITTITHVDKISDVMIMVQLLTSLGCFVWWNDSTLHIDATNINNVSIDRQLASQLRGSIFLLGALIGRKHMATTYMPGGCAIGSRPIDIHIDALGSLGVQVDIYDDKLLCSADNLVGNDIYMRMPSVGATENAIMCAVLAKGTTVIHGCAIEPEVVALQNSLVDMGAKIDGIGTRQVTIEGVHSLHGVTIRPIPDRIVTATYIVATCMTQGDVTIHNVCRQHIEPLLDIVSNAGVYIIYGSNSLRVVSNGYQSRGDIVTAPYPLFATDMQSLVLSMATVANGRTSITETLFENRLQSNCNQLLGMGANISLDGNKAIIDGVEYLYGCQLRCTDLRGGAALILASLCAKGCSVVEDIHHVNRGYYRLRESLCNIGADITIEY